MWASTASATVTIPLREVKPGLYVGEYTVRRRDDPDAFRDAQAMLRNGDQRVTVSLGERDHDRGDRDHGPRYGNDR